MAWRNFGSMSKLELYISNVLHLIFMIIIYTSIIMVKVTESY